MRMPGEDDPTPRKMRGTTAKPYISAAPALPPTTLPATIARTPDEMNTKADSWTSSSFVTSSPKNKSFAPSMPVAARTRASVGISAPSATRATESHRKARPQSFCAARTETNEVCVVRLPPRSAASSSAAPAEDSAAGAASAAVFAAAAGPSSAAISARRAAAWLIRASKGTDSGSACLRVFADRPARGTGTRPCAASRHAAKCRQRIVEAAPRLRGI
mmetsp:Transcript_1288/g.3969  ORF Transcript_1288/g.3969 Transcript_1288/m.3969 type:complete len:218 (-) Transcript_1288:34-687(-)